MRTEVNTIFDRQTDNNGVLVFYALFTGKGQLSEVSSDDWLF